MPPPQNISIYVDRQLEDLYVALRHQNREASESCPRPGPIESTPIRASNVAGPVAAASAAAETQPDSYPNNSPEEDTQGKNKKGKKRTRSAVSDYPPLHIEQHDSPVEKCVTFEVSDGLVKKVSSANIKKKEKNNMDVAAAAVQATVPTYDVFKVYMLVLPLKDLYAVWEEGNLTRYINAVCQALQTDKLLVSVWKDPGPRNHAMCSSLKAAALLEAPQIREIRYFSGSVNFIALAKYIHEIIAYMTDRPDRKKRQAPLFRGCKTKADNDWRQAYRLMLGEIDGITERKVAVVLAHYPTLRKLLEDIQKYGTLPGLAEQYEYGEKRKFGEANVRKIVEAFRTVYQS